MYKLTNKDRRYIFINKLTEIYWNYHFILQFLLPVLFGFTLKQFTQYFMPEIYEDQWNIYKQLDFISYPTLFLKRSVVGFLSGFFWAIFYLKLMESSVEISNYLRKNIHLIEIAESEFCKDVKDYMIDNMDVAILKVAEKYKIANDFFKDSEFIQVNTINEVTDLNINRNNYHLLDIFYFKYNLLLTNKYYKKKALIRMNIFKDELLEKTWQFHRIRDWIEPDINHRW